MKIHTFQTSLYSDPPAPRILLKCRVLKSGVMSENLHFKNSKVLQKSTQHTLSSKGEGCIIVLLHGLVSN